MNSPHATAGPPATAGDNSDALLVQRCVSGDVSAFDLLVIKYQRRVRRLIGRMVRDADLVEDIAQETFIRAYRALHQFQGEAQFYTWLYRIAVNTAKQFLNKLQREPQLADHIFLSDGDLDETFSSRDEPSTDETPESILAAKEIISALDQAMAALPDDLRTALSLREIERLSYEEIAQSMACPVGTVRSRIFRARESISAVLKPLLERQGGKRW